MADLTPVLVLSTDLMSAVRIADTAAAHGYDVRTIDKATDLADASAGLVVLDVAASPMEPAEAVADLRRISPEARIVAVYRHTDPEQARRARAAGCDLVLNRAQFFGDIPAALLRLRETA